jgi:hypothetical protein
MGAGDGSGAGETVGAAVSCGTGSVGNAVEAEQAYSAKAQHAQSITMHGRFKCAFPLRCVINSSDMIVVSRDTRVNRCGFSNKSAEKEERCSLKCDKKRPALFDLLNKNSKPTYKRFQPKANERQAGRR